MNCPPVYGGSTSRETMIPRDAVRWKPWSTARAAGVGALTLVPALDDFNEDLRRLGTEVLRNGLRAQLAPEDRIRMGPS